MSFKETFEIGQLDNGLIFAIDEMPYTEAVSINLLTAAGSLVEDWSGLGHFKEHMTFKGTKNRTAEQINNDFEIHGGDPNAQAGHECTILSLDILNDYAEVGLDILGDIDNNSIYPSEEIKLEKGTIRDEICAEKDMACDYVVTLAFKSCFDGSALGRPILGTMKSVKSITRQHLLDYSQNHFSTSQKILVVTGNVNRHQIIDQAEKLFGHLKPAKPNKPAEHIFKPAPVFEPREQDYIETIISFEGLNYNHKDYNALRILSNMMGGGMSSRLFQELREKTGLVYDIGTSIESFQNAGLFQICWGMNADRAKDVMPLIKETINAAGNVKEFTEHEFLRAQRQLRTNACFDIDGTVKRTEKMTTDLFRHGRIITQAEEVQMLNNVSLDEVNNLAKKLFSSEWAYASVGPEKEIHRSHEWLTKHYRA